MQPPPSPHAAQQQNAQGLAALKAGDAARAVQYFDAAIALDPEAMPLWRNKATACRALGDDAGEVAALDKALSIDRTDFGSWLRKAQLHQRRGESFTALEAWSATLQLSANFPNLPPQIVAELNEGRAVVDAMAAHVTDTVENELADDLSRMGQTDRRRSRAFLDIALHARRRYVNECSGLFYPFLPPDEFFDERHFEWFDGLRAAAADVRAEFLALQAERYLPLRPYVRMDAGTPANKWSPLDGSSDWSAAFLWEYGEPNQELLDRCPKTAAMLAAIPRTDIPGRAPTAFFSILRAGAHIPPHTGVTNTRAIIHLPLVVPAGCWFRVGGETRSWVEGEPFAFDDTIEHEAANPSGEDRTVLILDVWNPHLSQDEQAVIAQYYAAADRAGLGSPLRDI